MNRRLPELSIDLLPDPALDPFDGRVFCCMQPAGLEILNFHKLVSMLMCRLSRSAIFSQIEKETLRVAFAT